MPSQPHAWPSKRSFTTGGASSTAGMFSGAGSLSSSTLNPCPLDNSDVLPENLVRDLQHLLLHDWCCHQLLCSRSPTPLWRTRGYVPMHMALLPHNVFSPGTTQLEARERCQGENNRLKIIALTIRPVKACGDQIIVLLLISGIGEPFAHLFDGRRSFKRTEHLAPSPRRFVVGRGMVIDSVTCTHVEPIDECTNSYVKSFLVAEKRSARTVFLFSTMAQNTPS